MECSLYVPDNRWKVRTMLKLFAIAFFIGYLFYNRYYGFIFVLPFMMPVFKGEKLSYVQNVQARVKADFAEFLGFVSANLGAGYSLENAFARALNECEDAYGNMLITGELKKVVNGTSCGKRLEDMLMDFGNATGIREITDLSELIVLSKIYGGNIIHVIRMATSNYRENLLMEQELKTTLSAKKFEGKIMLLSPFLIVIYMRITNGDYMDVLYTTFLGHIVMTIGLAVIMTAWMLTNKITRIEV